MATYVGGGLVVPEFVGDHPDLLQDGHKLPVDARVGQAVLVVGRRCPATKGGRSSNNGASSSILTQPTSWLVEFINYRLQVRLWVLSVYAATHRC